MSNHRMCCCWRSCDGATDWVGCGCGDFCAELPEGHPDYEEGKYFGCWDADDPDELVPDCASVFSPLVEAELWFQTYAASPGVPKCDHCYEEYGGICGSAGVPSGNPNFTCSDDPVYPEQPCRTASDDCCRDHFLPCEADIDQVAVAVSTLDADWEVRSAGKPCSLWAITEHAITPTEESCANPSIADAISSCECDASGTCTSEGREMTVSEISVQIRWEATISKSGFVVAIAAIYIDTNDGNGMQIAYGEAWGEEGARVSVPIDWPASAASYACHCGYTGSTTVDCVEGLEIEYGDPVYSSNVAKIVNHYTHQHTVNRRENEPCWATDSCFDTDTGGPLSKYRCLHSVPSQVQYDYSCPCWNCQGFDCDNPGSPYSTWYYTASCDSVEPDTCYAADAGWCPEDDPDRGADHPSSGCCTGGVYQWVPGCGLDNCCDGIELPQDVCDPHGTELDTCTDDLVQWHTNKRLAASDHPCDCDIVRVPATTYSAAHCHCEDGVVVNTPDTISRPAWNAGFCDEAACNEKCPWTGSVNMILRISPIEVTL